MIRSPWRRFRSADPPCVAGMEEGVTYTSHHLRCSRIESTAGKSSRQANLPLSSSPWPGTFIQSHDDLSSNPNVSSPQRELRYSSTKVRYFSYKRTTPTLPCAIRPPPRCRLPQAIRFTTLVSYISIIILLLSCLAEASPLPHARQGHSVQLVGRQAIPDKFGNTGNEPAPVAPQPPPRPASSAVVTESTRASPSTLTEGTTTTTTATSETPTSSLIIQTTSTLPISSGTTTTPSEEGPGFPNPTNFAAPDGNGDRPGEVGVNPGAPLAPLTLTSPNNTLSLGAIAGLAGGGFVILCLLVAFGVWAYRRRPSNNVAEIPIRRSKLGSRLGFRIFGDGGSRSASRSSSRRGSKEEHNEKSVDAGWVDKGTISRPKNAWLENGLLSVPRPGFLRDGRAEKEDTTAPWVGKEDISGPRPGRPASAEPLGRLSGMGMGMGYLK